VFEESWRAYCHWDRFRVLRLLPHRIPPKHPGRQCPTVPAGLMDCFAPMFLEPLDIVTVPSQGRPNVTQCILTKREVHSFSQNIVHNQFVPQYP
jgi:hypothetical protein